MINDTTITILVSATTANLGPGFDCLGLSLDLWNEVTVSLTGRNLSIRIEGEGQKFLQKDSENLIFRSFCMAAEKYSIKIPEGIEIRCKNQIPISSGLGSSASAIIAGLLATNNLFDLNLKNSDILRHAMELEGHADNVAACLLGGLVIVANEGESLLTKKVGIKPLYATIALPGISLSTITARNALPKNYKKKDVVFNINRTALLVEALTSGKIGLLHKAMEDRIHQPYRLNLVRGGEKAMQAALDAGADGAALSGAGPSIIALHELQNEKIGLAMKLAFEKEKTPVRIFSLSTTNTGAFVA